MGFTRGVRNSIAFLTIIPIGMDKDAIFQAASYMPLFPLVGGLVGLLAGVSVWGLDAILPPQISGMIGVGILLLITGAHHTDGLLDFGDAVIFHGSRREKISILHDPQTGVGGLLLGILVLMITALCIGSLDRGIIVQSLVVSEAGAKFALAFIAATGKSAFRGMNTQFVKAMHDRFRSARLASSLLLLFMLSLPTLRILGIAATVSVTARPPSAALLVPSADMPSATLALSVFCLIDADICSTAAEVSSTLDACSVDACDRDCAVLET